MCAKMVASCWAVGKGLLRDPQGLLREQTPPGSLCPEHRCVRTRALPGGSEDGQGQGGSGIGVEGVLATAGQLQSFLLGEGCSQS